MEGEGKAFFLGKRKEKRRQRDLLTGPAGAKPLLPTVNISGTTFFESNI
jgi:hypothetical protein